MGKFSNNAITDAGRILLGEVQMGATFVPTKIVLGSGRMASGATARSMTAVVAPVVELTINKKQLANDGTVVIGGAYSNASVTKDWYFRELAIFAKARKADGTEIAEVLYSYGNAGEAADLMPAYASGTPVERQIDVVTYIGNDAKVDVTLASGLYVPYTEKGAAGGVATLGEDGIVPASQLPKVATLDETNKLDEGQIPNIDCGIWD